MRFGRSTRITRAGERKDADLTIGVSRDADLIGNRIEADLIEPRGIDGDAPLTTGASNDADDPSDADFVDDINDGAPLTGGASVVVVVGLGVTLRTVTTGRDGAVFGVPIRMKVFIKLNT